MKLTEEDITLTDNGCILIKVDGYGHVEEQLKSRILRSLRLMELVDKEYDKIQDDLALIHPDTDYDLFEYGEKLQSLLERAKGDFI